MIRLRLLALLCGGLLLAGCASAAAYSGNLPTAPVGPPGTSNAVALLALSPEPAPTDPIAEPTGATATLSPSPSPVPTETATQSPTPTRTHTPTPSSTQTATPSATHTPRPTSTPRVRVQLTREANLSASAQPDQAISLSRLRTQLARPPTNTPVVPKADPSVLVRPPDGVTLDPHLYFVRPVGLGGNVSPSAPYRYGMTFDGTLAPHHAVDVSNPPGFPVVAAGPGTVLYAGDDRDLVFGTVPDFYGNLVVLEMTDTWNGHTIYTLYGHLSTVAVETGQTVFAGDLLGGVGSSGIAGSPHLHFEVRLNDPRSYWAVRNPELWYRPIPGQGVLAGRVLDRRGRFIPGQRIEIQCADGARRYYDTYWDQGTPPDDVLVENFALSDVPAGFCQVETEILGTLVRQSVQIRPGEIAFVILELPR